MINKDTLAKMKDGAILINTARGKLIVDEDLVEALNSGKIRYAGLDVYHSEPLKDSGLQGVENILLIPHLGAQTYENMDRIGEIVIKLVSEHVKTV
jgi:D-3-phosphoglycerate dehydrogenase